MALSTVTVVHLNPFMLDVDNHIFPELFLDAMLLPSSRRLLLRSAAATARHRRYNPSSLNVNRFFSASSTLHDDDVPPRESMPFDVLIVGGGPAGLAASIRIKQLCAQHGKDLSVCLIDKGRCVGVC